MGDAAEKRWDTAYLPPLTSSSATTGGGGRVRLLCAFSRAREAVPSAARRILAERLKRSAGGFLCCQNSAVAATSEVRGQLRRQGDRKTGVPSLRRVLALIFGRDFIHWRRCGES